MEGSIRILIVEDLPTDAELAEREIHRALEACEFQRVETREDYLKALERFQPDLIVSDYRLPHFDGLTALQLALEHTPLTPVIIWTGSMNEDIAVECMKAGATNYVIKERIKRLGTAVIHALEEKQVRQERRQAEQALRESEERFRSLYENATIGLYRTTPEGQILMANPAAVRMLGYHSFDELAQRDLEKEGFDAALPRSEFRRRLESEGVITGLESAWIRRDGTTIFVRESARAIRDETGKVLYYDGTFEDITERRRAEEALRESEARLQKAQDVAGIGFLDWDLRTGKIFLSDQAYRLYGLERNDILATPELVIQAVHPEDMAKVQQNIEMALRGEKEYDIDQRIVRPDGKTLWIHALAELVPDEEGNLKTLLITVVDITERKRAEERIRREAARAETLVRTAARLNATLDLNNALNTVCEETAKALNVPIVNVFLYDEASDLLCPAMSFGVLPEHRQYLPQLPRRILDELSQQRGPVVTIPDSRKVSNLPYAAERAQADVRSLIFAIMQYGDKLTGVLSVISIGEEREFDPDELALFRGIADQAAMAISNARLFTQQKLVEEALRTSEERYRTVSELTSDFAYAIRIEPDGSFMPEWTTEAFGRITGYDLDFQMNARAGWMSIIHPDDVPIALQHLQANLSGKTDATEYRIIDKSGQVHWVREYGHPIWDETQDRVVRIIGAAQDITERKQAEESLRRYADDNARLLEAERQQRELAETLREVGATLAATLDADTVLDRLLEQVGRVVPHEVANVMIIEGHNVRVVRSRGYEEFGIDISAAYIPHSFADVPNFVTMAETGEPTVISDVPADPNWVRRSEMTWRRSYLGVPVRARGKAIGFLNVSHSTPGYYTSEHAERLCAFADQAAIALENARLYATEQQRATALARALEQQRELERLQREFVQNVSHELRTPLALIRGHAEVLEAGWLGKLPPEQQESIHVISRRAHMLGKLVDDIMSILEVERRELKREPVDLTLLVQTSLADFRPAADKADLTLSAEIVPGVPPIIGDSVALRRMLDNLVSNATKFTLAGGRVNVYLSCREQAVRLQVADTGIGIPGDQLGRIFERFYQVDGSATRRYGGVGLGLALVKSIVEAHHGQITVTSQVGVGTTFTIVLPITAQDDTETR